MSRLEGLARGLLIVLTGLGAVIAVTWALQHVIPPPYSGYLAITLVGLAAIQIVKRTPWQRALRLFRTYLRQRARGTGETAARERLLTRLPAADPARGLIRQDLADPETAGSEKDRMVAVVARLLERQGARVDRAVLRAAWDRERDRFMIAGWQALPKEFVDEVHRRLSDDDRAQLERLVDKYALFQQGFFKNASALAANPGASAVDFARLLHSVGNKVADDQPGDAERAYRLSLVIRPERNLAHAGLALLLARTGRTAQAAREARSALEALDAFERAAVEDTTPSTEDISPFRSPAKLREALQRVIGSG